MQVVDPRVSTDYRFFTNTFLAPILFAAKDMHTVIVISNPSGTLATIIPMTKVMFTIMLYP
jgi:hypothetical protein